VLVKRLNESHNDDPQNAVRPFDENAQGAVIGEGGGLFILENYEHAKKRGAKIYAELIGFAASQDAYKITEPDPSGHSYGKAIENAMKDAKISAKDVDVLVPHGLGVAAFDRAELNGLKKSLGSELSRIALAPIKAQIGNAGPGCGVDAAAAVLSIHSGKIPPAINTKKIIDGQKLNVAGQVRDISGKVAVSSVYSLGGQNAALVFKTV
jgi:3-oxoacyl-[acyl-carrier-protein] synthase II